MTTLGDLNQRVSIYEPSAYGDGSGGETVDWALKLQAYAAVKPVQANESETHGGLRSVQVYLFTVRRSVAARLNATMRLDWGGMQFNIREVRLGPPSDLFVDIKAETGVPL